VKRKGREKSCVIAVRGMDEDAPASAETSNSYFSYCGIYWHFCEIVKLKTKIIDFHSNY